MYVTRDNHESAVTEAKAVLCQMQEDGIESLVLRMC